MLPGVNTFSDVDCIRYGKVSSISEIVFDQKSEYSFKEVLTPISQTLFFFVDRTGFEEFKRWALKGVTLPDRAEVSQTMYWKGIKY